MLVSVIAAAALTACGTQPTVDRTSSTPGPASALPQPDKAFPEITGTVTYRERIALPATAVVMVRLLDASRQDVAAVLIGEQLIPTQGRQVPFRYAIPYDPDAIDARGRYIVQARIEDRGRLRFVTDRAYAVITQQGGTRADLVLKAVD